MPKHVDALRGASKLAVDATEGVTELVQELHDTIASGPFALPVRAVSGIVYSAVRAVTRLTGAGVDVALEQLAPLLQGEVASAPHDAVLAALNGVLGDYLAETGNPLAIPFSLRGARTGKKLLVLVHGSSMNDLQWLRLGHDHGAALAKDLGFTPVYARYNSGLHVSQNGRSLSDALEALVAQWEGPLESITLLGHSMGGLVSRSAVLCGEGTAWRKKLRALVCLGTPHHGAPLERGGNWLGALLGVSAYSAPFMRLAKLRSAGVTDLRFGNVLDEHWNGRDRFELGGDARAALSLPEGVLCCALAGSSGEKGGDGLVPIDSALGRHVKRELQLGFQKTHVAKDCTHLDLLSRADVYAVLREWLS